MPAFNIWTLESLLELRKPKITKGSPKTERLRIVILSKRLDQTSIFNNIFKLILSVPFPQMKKLKPLDWPRLYAYQNQRDPTKMTLKP